jgi:hypothetical protein
MPGNLLKVIDSQADWQSGTLENLDATTSPGSIIPTGDYTKTYDTEADWNLGTRVNVASDASGQLSLTLALPNWKSGTLTASSYNSIHVPARAIDGNTETRWGSDEASNEWLMMDYGDSPHIVTKLRLYGANTTYVLKDFRFEASNDKIQWTTLATGTAPHYASWQEWSIPLPGPYRYYRLYCIDNYGGQGSIHLYEMELVLRSEYLPSGSWTSPWIAHGIVAPYAGWLKATQQIPSRCGVAWEVRHSPDGGATFGDWLPVDGVSAKIPGTIQTHLQVRALLTSGGPAPAASPVLDALWLLVGPIHRWTSLPMDISSVRDLLMVLANVPGLRVQVFGFISKNS